MSRVASLVSDFTADDRVFQRVSARVERSMLGIQKRALSVSAVAGQAFAALGLGVGAAAGALGFAAKQASDAEEAQAKLLAVLKATGHGAGVTLGQLSEFAKKMQAVTKFEDDATKASLAVLASFRNIRGDNFTRAAESAMDLATVTGTDLTTAMRTVGKALNTPQQGLAALQRSGVAFTDQQRRMIAAFDQLGLTTKSQDVILRALAKSFGGAAEAAGGTLAGQLAILRHEVGDVGEEIGKIFLPHLKALTKWLRSNIPTVGEMEAKIAAVKATVDRLAESIAGIGGAAEHNLNRLSIAFEDAGLTGEIAFERIRIAAAAATQAVRDVAGTAKTLAVGILDSTINGRGGLIEGVLPLARKMAAASDDNAWRRIEELERKRNEIAERRINSSLFDDRATPGAGAAKSTGGLSPFKAAADAVAGMQDVASRVAAVLAAAGQSLLGAAWKEAGRRAKIVDREPRVGGFQDLAEMHRSIQKAAVSDPKTDKLVSLTEFQNTLLGKVHQLMQDMAKRPPSPLFR